MKIETLQLRRHENGWGEIYLHGVAADGREFPAAKIYRGEHAAEVAALFETAPQLLAVCEALFYAASWNEETRCWTIGPFADDPEGRIPWLGNTIQQARSRE